MIEDTGITHSAIVYSIIVFVISIKWCENIVDIVDQIGADNNWDYEYAKLGCT